MEIFIAILLAVVIALPSIAFYMVIDAGMKQRAKQRDQMQRMIDEVKQDMRDAGLL